MKTYSPKPGEVEKKWWVIDATDVVLGRLAVASANLLRGKHKPAFARHINTGDNVVIINAEKIALSGDKLVQKRLWRHSGFPGGISSRSYGELLQDNPVRIVENAVKGMIPKTTLGRTQLSNLHVYAGNEHPHVAQNPQKFDTKTQVKQGA
ncbi:MAG: 50S ribosomal protein L13 [Candidatus Ancillula sp.]|jgi:large subunit ribosomal protein L13|nr:50S ribosomal protein L13 [Candidatus Ancillula sp.]